MVSLPPVNHHVQGNEEGFEVHAPPFGPGCGGGGGEMRIPPDILLRRAETWRGQDLELDTLIGAMAVGDPSLFDVVGSVILTSVTDPDAIVYRQCALADCLEQPSIIRQMYDIAVEARERASERYIAVCSETLPTVYSAGPLRCWICSWVASSSSGSSPTTMRASSTRKLRKEKGVTNEL